MVLKNLLKDDSSHKLVIRKLQLEQKIINGMADAELRGEVGAFVNTEELDIVEEVADLFRALPGHAVSIAPITGYRGNNLIRFPRATVFVYWGKG